MALQGLGFGANLQHYNPLIDETVAKTWGIPQQRKHIAQMVFGSPEGSPNDKTQTKPVNDRLKMFGNK
jgi:predicted oxidoreductase (fatty acid repression mutant protein)